MKFECSDLGFLGCMLLVLWVSSLLVAEKIMGFVGFDLGVCYWVLWVPICSKLVFYFYFYLFIYFL